MDKVVLEDYGFAERLIGITADNASNNSTMMAEVENHYQSKYQNAGLLKFSLEPNRMHGPCNFS